MSWTVLVLACILVALGAWAATWAVREALVRWCVYDTPNARSSHTAPVPRGGGLALVPMVLAAWIAHAAWTGAAPPGLGMAVAGATVLAAVSWIDDLRGLPAGARLAVQAGAVGLGMVGLTGEGSVFQGWLPPGLDAVAAGLVWLWFVNLFNFMDGIDGISGVEAGSIGVGLVLVGALAGWPWDALAPPALLTGAVLGFLAWNWAPARIFLGDVGSVPLGFLLGWLLLRAAIAGEWVVALILPLYYLADATITLARRAARGERIWRAHRKHFYQRAALGGAGHARVALLVLACNIALIACAGAAARDHAGIAFALAGVAVACLLGVLARHARRAPVPPPGEMR